VLAGDRQREGREDAVDVGDRSSGDQRERAAEGGVSAQQQLDRLALDGDRVRCLGDMQQRAVDVEIEGDPGRARGRAREIDRRRCVRGPRHRPVSALRAAAVRPSRRPAR
jgi:hypothetical protein